MCDQILKKDSAPIQFKFFELEKTKRRPIIAPAIVVRLINNQLLKYKSTKNWTTMDRQLVFKIQTSSSEGEVIFESPFPKIRNLSTKLTQKFGEKD